MEKLLLILMCLFCFDYVPVESQEDCVYAFFTATCNPEIPLTVIPDDIPVQVAHIVLEGNDIATIHPGNLSYYPALFTLDLSDNLITHIPANLESEDIFITELTLDGNPITTIEDRAFEHFPALTALSLRNTELTMLGNDTLYGLTSLNELNLRNSKLSSLSVNVFQHSTDLETLALDYNNLQTMPDGLFDGISFDPNELDLSYNPWSCDCRMKWFRTYLDANLAAIDSDTLRCSWPHTNTLMTDLTVDNFVCTEPSVVTHPANDSILTNRSYTLYLEVSGAPFPNVTWFRDGQPVNYDENVYLNLYDASLHFKNTLVEHDGVYYAEISNDEGSAISNEATLIVTEVTCFNDLKDNHETDLDCGGQYCTPCNYTQNCLMDRDCEGELICLYPYELLSNLYYINPTDPMAYTCDYISVAEELLNERLQIGLQSPGLFGSNLTVGSVIGDVQNSMRKLLSEMLTVSEVYITDVRVTTVERSATPQSNPLIQIWFSLVKNSEGRNGRSNLLDLIDNGEISGTIRIKEDQSYYHIRLNL